MFFWGEGFRQDRVRAPTLLFSTNAGVKDLKVGWRHVLYVDEEQGGLYSWGDTTFGQTGNAQTAASLLKEQEMKKVSITE